MTTPHSLTNATPFPPFQAGQKLYNLATTQSKTEANPRRCWVNIVKKKLYSFSDDTPWLFDCYVDGNRYVYCATVKDLKMVFNAVDVQYMKKEDKYSFYIDHVRGILYTSASESTGRALIILNLVQNGDQYAQLLKRLPARM